MKRTVLATAAAVVVVLSLGSAPVQASAPAAAAEFNHCECWYWHLHEMGGFSLRPNYVLYWWNPHCWYAWATGAGFG